MSLREPNNVKALFCPVVPDIRESITLFADQEVSPLVLLITVWNICGMTWTGGKRRSRRKDYPSATLSTANPTRTGSRPNPGLHGKKSATNLSERFHGLETETYSTGHRKVHCTHARTHARTHAQNSVLRSERPICECCMCK